jgi:hypothetical protein
MCWTLQNLKDSENKQKMLHYGSIFRAARVLQCPSAWLLTACLTGLEDVAEAAQLWCFMPICFSDSYTQQPQVPGN